VLVVTNVNMKIKRKNVKRVRARVKKWCKE